MQRIEVAGGIERAGLALPVGEQGGQLGRRAPIAAGQADPGRHPLVERLQPGRVEIDAVEIAAEAVRRVLQRCLGAAQRLDRAGECGVVGNDALQRIDGAAGQHVGAGIGFGDGVERFAGRIEQRLRVGQPGVLGVELGPFVGAGGELVDLGDLPGQPLALALEIALPAARGFERLQCRAPG